MATLGPTEILFFNRTEYEDLDSESQFRQLCEAAMKRDHWNLRLLVEALSHSQRYNQIVNIVDLLTEHGTKASPPVTSIDLGLLYGRSRGAAVDVLKKLVDRGDIEETSEKGFTVTEQGMHSTFFNGLGSFYEERDQVAQLYQRIAFTSSELQILATGLQSVSINERLAYLFDLITAGGSKQSDSFSHEQLTKAITISRPSLTLNLKLWEQEGLIQRAKRSYMLTEYGMNQIASIQLTGSIKYVAELPSSK